MDMHESLLIAQKMRRQSVEWYLTDFVAARRRERNRAIDPSRPVEEQAPINAISTHIDMEEATLSMA
jgi:hypothetical protein